MILLSTVSDSTAVDYIPIYLRLGIVFTFVAVTIVATHLLGPSLKSKVKLENFESGIKSVGDARQPLAVKYFLVAILFVLFDVEVIFFYPYAVNFKALGWAGFGAVVTFVLLFLLGYFYIRKKGALNWAENDLTLKEDIEK